MLADYDQLVETLHKVHVAIHAQLDYMGGAVGETLMQYTRTGDEHAGVFQNVFGDRHPRGS